MYLSLIMWVASLFSNIALAGDVRTIYLDQTQMAPVHLKLGQSTVLRFSEKPKKVVIGNQNLFSVEFIDSDVTLQPLGNTSSNLFVYAERHTYGFLLHTGSTAAYDDLVNVKWKNTIWPVVGVKSPPPPPQIPVKLSMPKLGVKVGKMAKVSIEKILGPTALGVHLIDLKITSFQKSDLSLKDLRVQFLSDVDLGDSQSFVLQKDIIHFKEYITARLIFKLKSRKNARLLIRFGNDTATIKILRKYL